MVRGDQVVFARLDLADIFGIWCHATGRIVDMLLARDGAQVVNVPFEGHGLLMGHVAALFQRVG